MNATSSLLPSTMDDPFTDTMDMASPYQGHVDDFEIDIDIMEDQPTVADDDFDLQDASPEADLTNDADMMEDAPEITVTEAPRYNDDSNMQYSSTFDTNLDTFESEMVDEEYQSNEVAAPEPETLTTGPEQSSLIIENTTKPLQGPPTHNEDKSDQQDTNIDEDKQEMIAVENSETQEPTEEGQASLKEDELHVASEPQAETAVELSPEHRTDNAETDDKPPQLEPDTETTEGVVEIQDTEESYNDEDAAATTMLPPTDTQDEPEEDQEVSAEPLRQYIHPIKVIYQESEISMFPPRDGDTSETYFLANEALANEGIDELLKECRTVLGDHASSEESLMFHIDSLGIELSEDNIHVGKVTLSQIVNLYLQLCRNSGLEQPEPLYLTLSTRSNLPADVAALQTAASEGKGISDIQTWEEEYEQQDYEETNISTQDVGQVEHDEPAEFDQKNLPTDREHQELEHVAEIVTGETVEGKSAAEVHEDREATHNDIEPPELEEGELSAENDDERDEIAEETNDFDDTNSASTTTQNSADQSEHQPGEVLSTNNTQAETQRADVGLLDNEDETGLSNTQVLEADSHLERGAHEEYVDDENEAEEQDSDADATAEGVDYPETHEQEQPAEEVILEHNEADVVEDNEDDEEEYDDYANDERHSDFNADDETGEELLVGNEENEEPSAPDLEPIDDAYAADQLDQVSSGTVSALNDPVDNHGFQLDNLQTVGEADVSEGVVNSVPQTTDFPDLPEDDLISLGDDFLDNPEEDDGQDTHGDKGLDVLPSEQRHDASVDLTTNDDEDKRKNQLQRQESNTGKRPRDIEEEEFGLDGTLSPGSKRTRSS